MTAPDAFHVAPAADRDFPDGECSAGERPDDCDLYTELRQRDNRLDVDDPPETAFTIATSWTWSRSPATRRG